MLKLRLHATLCVVAPEGRPKMDEEKNPNPGKLITAAVLESVHGIPKSSSYRAAKEGKIPHYKVGLKKTGIRFIASEVFEALRQPARQKRLDV